MTPEQLRELQQTIADSIEKNVNGKIRALDAKVDNYIKTDLDHKERDREETNEWRKGADDKLAIVGSVQGFGKVTAYILGMITVVGGATLFIVKLLEWIRK